MPDYLGDYLHARARKRIRMSLWWLITISFCMVVFGIVELARTYYVNGVAAVIWGLGIAIALAMDWKAFNRGR